jgi:hypothetical protein
MWVRLLSIISLIIGLLLVVCTVPTPPPGPDSAFVALELKSSNGTITKNLLTDTIENQITICVIHNQSQFIDASKLSITKGTEFNQVYPVKSFKGLVDTSKFTMTFSVPGIYDVSFSCYIDGKQTILNGTITILDKQHTTQNKPPVLSLTKEVNTGAGQELVIPVSATDHDTNQQVTITVVKKPESATFKANQFKWTPMMTDTGVVLVIFSATDNGSPALSTTDTCVITVKATPVNRAPTWSMVSIQRSALPDTLFSLDLSDYCIDLDNDSLTFSLLPNAPAKDTIAGKMYQFTPSLSDTGVYSIPIVATDPSGLTNTFTLELTISKTIINKPDKVPPVITLKSPSKDTVISVDSCEVQVICIDDSGCSVKGYRDGIAFDLKKSITVANLWTVLAKGITAGNYSVIKIIATDSSAAGNKDSVSVRIKYDNDIAGPVVTLVKPTAKSTTTNTSSYSIELKYTDVSGVAAVEGVCGTNTVSGVHSGDNWIITMSNLVLGDNTIIITAKDSSLRANKTIDTLVVTYDPTIEDKVGPVIKQISGQVSGTIVNSAVVEITDSISDPSGVDSVYWTHNNGIKKIMTPVSGKTGIYSLKDTLQDGVLDSLIIIAKDKSSNKNYSRQVITLTYILPPSITKQPVSQTVCAGSQAIFTITASGTAPLSYQWRAGAVAPFVKVGGNNPACSLSLTSTAILSCVVSNGSGVDAISVPCTLTVTTGASKPVVGATPSTICSGSSALLSATGDPGTGGKWVWYSSKTGTALPSLSVSPATSTWYFVRSEGGNCGNSAWDSVQITVNSAPTKPVLEASSTTSCSGDPVTLKVNSGNPGTNGIWAWYTDASWSLSSKVGTGTSIDVFPTSSTTYYVRSEGGTCPNTSAIANIAITVNSRSVAPTSITSSGNPVCAGSSVTLTVTDGVLGPNASWQWYTNAECTIKATGTRGGTNGSTLTTTINARTSLYVRAEGGCNGNTGTAYTTVAIVTPITFTTNPESVSMCNDASWATFSLYASGGGTAQLNYQWKRNGVVITDGTNYKNTKTRSLEVLASEYTIGDFTCTVDNGNGCSNTSAPATLSIEYSHLTILTPMNGSATEGSLAGCDVTVTGGSGNYIYQWYKDDVALSPDPDRQFDPYSRTWYIVPVKKSDAGRYNCRVRDADIPGCPAISGYSTLTVTDPNP